MALPGGRLAARWQEEGQQEEEEERKHAGDAATGKAALNPLPVPPRPQVGRVCVGLWH